MPSDWNIFVSKIYKEGHDKDSSYQFKDAMMDASKRKSEMGPATAKPASAKSASASIPIEFEMRSKRHSRKKKSKKKSHGKKSHKKSRKMHKKSHRGRRGH
jgi:hypothetical protein